MSWHGRGHWHSVSLTLKARNGINDKASAGKTDRKGTSTSFPLELTGDAVPEAGEMVDEGEEAGS